MMPWKRWSPQEVAKLKQLRENNTPGRVIGLKLGRTADAVRSKVSKLGISVGRTNQSPHTSFKDPPGVETM